MTQRYLSQDPSQAESQAHPKLALWLDRLQIALLCLVAFLGVIASPRLLLYEVVTEQRNIPLDFIAITLSLADYLLIALVALTLARLFGAAYRQTFSEHVSAILTRRGGLFWVALMTWMGIGMAWAREPLLLRYTTLHAIGGLLLALAAADLVARHGARALLYALVAGAVAQTLLAVLQVVRQGPLGLADLGEVSRFYYETTAFYRPPGLSMHPNYLGGYLMLALFGCALLAWQRWQHTQQRPTQHTQHAPSTPSLRALVWPGALALVSGAGLVATVSRSAILSTVVGFAPLALALLLRLRGRARLLALGGLAALVVIGAAWAVIVVAGNVDIRFFAPREFFFEYSWQVIQQAPVIGVGAGNLMAEVGRIYGDSSRELLPVHNVYLYLWAEVGLPGLALFALAYLALLWSMRHRPETWIWAGALIGIASVMLFDNYWWAVHPFRVLMFWAVGLAWGLTLRPSAQAASTSATSA